MVFTTQYKQRVFDAYKNHKDLIYLLALLDDPNPAYSLIRNVMEDGLDSPDVTLDELLHGDGDQYVHNSKVTCRKQRTILYSEFMEEYTKALDEQRQVVKERKINELLRR